MKSRSRRLLCLTVAVAATTIVVLAAPSLASAGGVNYVTTTQTGQSIVPGTTDVGNHCDDCPTFVNFPFPVSVYGASYTSDHRLDGQPGAEALMVARAQGARLARVTSVIAAARAAGLLTATAPADITSSNRTE